LTDRVFKPDAISQRHMTGRSGAVAIGMNSSKDQKSEFLSERTAGEQIAEKVAVSEFIISSCVKASI